MSLHLFDAFGIELEYMIVDAAALNVRPISDFVLQDAEGNPTSEIERGDISWSNELTHHVIELKTNGPAPDLTVLAAEFQQSVQDINAKLAETNARLLPTAMHPWMDPDSEMQLWPHEYHTVYETFDKIFDCRGHGWANLQSMHINLPFSGDEEFGRLHAAIRLILPLLPAIAASSPFKDGRRTGLVDSRLDVYRRNAKGVASVTGRVIPEPVYDFAGYDREIFQPMFRDIAPLDPDGVLRNEFLNARGAIARFSRGAIEIRVIDVQECPVADLAIAALTIGVLKLLVAETWSSTIDQQSVSIDTLEPVLLAAIEQGEKAVISDPEVLRQFGVLRPSVTLSQLWMHLYDVVSRQDALFRQNYGRTLAVILNQGCLSSRILKTLNGKEDRASLTEVYRRLADCLATGEQFRSDR
ncbi:carboxylate-amine ligase [Planctomicrobium piriforme]|uniref:Glutamate-cysteine ligase family 2(GCS2) n=1 Tax=Planctomicrobium piriforme TaxID=1576369 RepID=A0A1I3SWB6_9PLAN|nr:glutamate-cysteine ligase family protein [Planctomicrobium piriforme]SFJ61766.1 Glutamate-cysteine ligase family 2(GCS2) [Planctomicrobium piriforme]